MRPMPWVCLAGVALFFLTGNVQAKPWVIDYPHSHLGFTATQNSLTFKGSFKTFMVNVDFDPDHPETSKISAIVDISSVGTGDPQRDSMLPQAEWFNTAKFPKAEFVSTQIRKTGANTYEAHGTLTIKGTPHPSTLPFTFIQQDDHWRTEGKTTILRSDFHIGEGQWSDEKYVKFGVDIDIVLTAKPQS